MASPSPYFQNSNLRVSDPPSVVKYFGLVGGFCSQMGGVALRAPEEFHAHDATGNVEFQIRGSLNYGVATVTGEVDE